MSNCYASYYTRIPYWTQEQQAWLENATTCHDVLTDALASPTVWDWDPQSEGIGEWDLGEAEWESCQRGPVNGEETPLGYLVLHECEANQADVAFLALVYNEKFGCLNELGWVMSVAYTADREGEDAFGGSCYAIYKGQTFFTSTYDYEDFFAEQNEIETIINTWQAAL